MAPEKGDEWEVLFQNGFDEYVVYNHSDGVVFTVMDNGEWVQAVSNGQNKNTSNVTTKNCIPYADIKDKTCRITWGIECSDISSFTTQNGGGFITFDFFNSSPRGSNPLKGRISKLDFATLTLGNIIGRHTLEFIPDEYFASVTKSTYLGWHFGFRSTVNDLTWSITELTFEVKK